jgi:hypothetical protein
VFRIRIGFNADLDPNPAVYLNADPDPNPDPGSKIRILVRLCSDKKLDFDFMYTCVGKKLF